MSIHSDNSWSQSSQGQGQARSVQSQVQRSVTAALLDLRNTSHLSMTQIRQMDKIMKSQLKLTDPVLCLAIITGHIMYILGTSATGLRQDYLQEGRLLEEIRLRATSLIAGTSVMVPAASDTERETRLLQRMRQDQERRRVQARMLWQRRMANPDQAVPLSVPVGQSDIVSAIGVLEHLDEPLTLLRILDLSDCFMHALLVLPIDQRATAHFNLIISYMNLFPVQLQQDFLQNGPLLRDLQEVCHRLSGPASCSEQFQAQTQFRSLTRTQQHAAFLQARANAQARALALENEHQKRHRRSVRHNKRETKPNAKYSISDQQNVARGLPGLF